MRLPPANLVEVLQRYWEVRGYRTWRKLRAGTLRKFGILPPPNKATPSLDDHAGYVAGLDSEPIFESVLRPDTSVLTEWKRRLRVSSETPVRDTESS